MYTRGRQGRNFRVMKRVPPSRPVQRLSPMMTACEPAFFGFSLQPAARDPTRNQPNHEASQAKPKQPKHRRIGATIRITPLVRLAGVRGTQSQYRSQSQRGIAVHRRYGRAKWNAGRCPFITGQRGFARTLKVGLAATRSGCGEIDHRGALKLWAMQTGQSQETIWRSPTIPCPPCPRHRRVLRQFSITEREEEPELPDYPKEADFPNFAIDSAARRDGLTRRVPWDARRSTPIRRSSQGIQDTGP